MVSYLSIIGFAKTDDPNAIGRFREAQDMQPTAKRAKRDVALFTIVATHIGMDERGFEIEFCGQRERQVALANVPLVLVLIEGDAH
jgi:hypothetical protein